MFRRLKLFVFIFMLLLLTGCQNSELKEIEYNVLLSNYKIDTIEENYNFNIEKVESIIKEIESYFIEDSDSTGNLEDYFYLTSDFNNFLFLKDRINLVCNQMGIDVLDLNIDYYTFLDEVTGNVILYLILDISDVTEMYVSLEIVNGLIVSIN